MLAGFGESMATREAAGDRIPALDVDVLALPNRLARGAPCCTNDPVDGSGGW